MFTALMYPKATLACFHIATIADVSNLKSLTGENPSLTKPPTRVQVPMSLLTYTDNYTCQVQEKGGDEDLEISKLREYYRSCGKCC